MFTSAIRREDGGRPGGRGDYIFWGGGRTPWTALGSEGGQLKASKLQYSNVTITNYPCPAGYSDRCLLEHTAPTNVGMWPSNVYHIGEDEVLAFTHMEFRFHGKWSVRHGLAYSDNVGQSFDWCGYIVAPAGDAGRSVKGETESPNMGLSNYM